LRICSEPFGFVSTLVKAARLSPALLGASPRKKLEKETNCLLTNGDKRAILITSGRNADEKFSTNGGEFSTASTTGLWKTQFSKNSSICTKLPRKATERPHPFLEKGFFYRFFLPPPREFLSVFG
jgi:hypothetical protein